MAKKDAKVTKKEYHSIILFVLLFFTLILLIVVGMNIKNSFNLRSIITESVKAQLISTSMAAGEILNVDDFAAYEDASVAERPSYQATLSKLRSLANAIDAKYIYALKRQGEEYVFVFDTDTEDTAIFVPYELSRVHEEAFAGKRAADIMNVDDDYGSFNTGAVPIMKDGAVIGIICTDFEDSYLERSYSTARFNSALLITILAITMISMLVAVIRLLNKVRAMQGKLERMAHYDNITGLPNRQYLLEYLANATGQKRKGSLALFFIDLDNFKAVNDNAGHDAGDELLRHVAQYLESSLQDGKSFRPSAGKLNIAARIGGDEFIQVIHHVESEEQAAQIAQKVLDGFKNEHTDRYVEKYAVGMSIGVALFPYHTEDLHVLIKYADVAMYYAKNAGKNQYRIYQDEMSKGEQ